MTADRPPTKVKAQQAVQNAGAVSSAPVGPVSQCAAPKPPPQPAAASSNAAAEGSSSTPIPQEKGVPTDIPADANSVVCKAGKLTVQNNNSGPDRACTQAHEESHIADWKARYGENLCEGVPDGQLPLGGDGYDEFLRKSECKAYKVGKACREKLKKATVSAADREAIQKSIDRDNAQIAALSCD